MPSIPPEKRNRWSRKRHRFGYWAVAILIAGIAGGIFVWPSAVSRYHRWNAHRHGRNASDFLAKGDFRHAVLSATKALENNPLDADATHIMAMSLDALGAPAAEVWRARLDTLRPGVAENVLARARTALGTNGVESAEQMLNSLDPAERNSAVFHAVAGAVAVEKRDLASAEAHWAEASRLEPEDVRHQVNLARVRLGSRTPGSRAAALAALEEMRARPSASLEALRILLADAIGNREAAQALKMADALVEDARSNFNDRLTRLSTLRMTGDARSGPYLLELRDESLSEPADLYTLLAWMNGRDLSLMVTEWVRYLPPDLLSKPPVCLAVAEAYSQTGDWEKLEEVTGVAPWAEMDYMRRAFLTRALERLDEGDEATHEWTEAVASARGRPDAGDCLERLAKIAAIWKWDRRAEEIMWTLATRPQCPRWVVDSLWKTAFQRGETAQLQKLSAVVAKLDPKGIAARNNYAFLSLLTRTDADNPHRIAETLHRESPENALVGSTYALSLYQQGKTDEAVALFSTLKPDDLRQPQVALYYAIFLLAAGQKEKADEYLKLSADWPMLPEEKALLDRVKHASLNEHGRPPARSAPADKKP